MSFSVQHLPTKLEYGSQDMFAQKMNYLNPKFFRMLLQIKRFYAESEEVLNDGRFLETIRSMDYMPEKKNIATTFSINILCR